MAYLIFLTKQCCYGEKKNQSWIGNIHVFVVEDDMTTKENRFIQRTQWEITNVMCQNECKERCHARKVERPSSFGQLLCNS